MEFLTISALKRYFYQCVPVLGVFVSCTSRKTQAKVSLYSTECQSVEVTCQQVQHNMPADTVKKTTAIAKVKLP